MTAAPRRLWHGDWAEHSTLTPPSGNQIELAHGDQRAVVVEVGGGLREYTVEGKDVLDGYARDEMCTVGRGQMLIPWPNRIRAGQYEWQGGQLQLDLSEPPRGNAIHGLVRWSNWTVESPRPDEAAASYLLHPSEGYPFALSLRIEYALGDRGLTVSTSATNVCGASCPFGAGSHPYLTVGTETIDTCTLTAPGATRLETDQRMIPIGSTPVQGTEYDFRAPRPIGSTQLDTGYGDVERDADGTARVTLEDPASRRALTLWMDRSYPYLMLFTGDSLPDESRRRRGLAVEPMTCAPNAFQSGDGLVTLEPGETFEGSWGIALG